LSLPPTPDDYKVELPQDFKTPEGVNFRFKDGDPLLAQARVMAHEMGISQQHFSRLLSLYAGAQVSEQQTINTARAAEIAKLGATATARVDAIGSWLNAKGVGPLMSMIANSAHVQMFEKLITDSMRQGGAPFSAGGRIPPEAPGKVDDATYDKMSYTEKKAYAERHQSNGGGQ
jgi:hypothetical protein